MAKIATDCIRFDTRNWPKWSALSNGPQFWSFTNLKLDAGVHVSLVTRIFCAQGSDSNHQQVFIVYQKNQRAWWLNICLVSETNQTDMIFLSPFGMLYLCVTCHILELESILCNALVVKFWYFWSISFQPPCPRSRSSWSDYNQFLSEHFHQDLGLEGWASWTQSASVAGQNYSTGQADQLMWVLLTFCFSGKLGMEKGSFGAYPILNIVNSK